MNSALLTNCIQKYTDEYRIPGYSIIVLQNHRELYRLTGGTSDAARTIPVSDADIYWLFSLSKLPTCTAAVQMLERGLLKLDAPVADYLPAFRHMQVRENGVLRPAKRPMTILDLFTMRGGLNYDLSGLAESCGSDADTRRIVDEIAKRPLDFDPGERFQYSLCHDVLAAAMEAASGVPFDQWLMRELFEPLGMTETRFEVHETPESKLAAQYIFEDGQPRLMNSENNYKLTLKYRSGGAGLCSTLRDYIKLIDALANGGEGANGARILTEDSVAKLALNRLDEKQTTELCAWRPGYGYGLGVRTRLPNAEGITEFGWDGAAGAYALCDTGSRLAVLYLQHVRNCGPIYDVAHPAFRDAVYAALE